MDRRTFLTVLAIGAVGTALDACDATPGSPASSQPPLPSPSASPSPLPSPSPHPHPHPQGFPPPVPGTAEVISHAPHPTQRVALTIDDGYDAETVSAYVAFAQRTGIHITFSPNGLYSGVWQPHAKVLRPLIEAGQVQIGNHTFDHVDLTRVSDATFREEVERNEQWIERTFRTSCRPYLRPPYGARDERTDGLCGDLGYTKVLLWDGTFGDSRLLTPDVLMAQARRWLQPGSVVLGHANHPTVTHLFDQLVELMQQRDLQPSTLDEMFGTRR